MQKLVLQQGYQYAADASVAGFRADIDADLPHGGAVAAGTGHAENHAVADGRKADLVRGVRAEGKGLAEARVAAELLDLGADKASTATD